MARKKDGRIWMQVGEMELCSPPIPDKSEFINATVKVKKDQRWRRHFPSDEEIERLSPADRKALRDEDVRRRLNGVWFFNDGDPTYITGIHYFYLTHYQLTNGNYPDFRDVDQEFFWWWDAIEKSNTCFGGLFVTRRQQGKTSKGACILLEHVTRVPKVYDGIQSKTGDDAKEIFTDFIVPQWKAMPAIIKPKSTLATSDPKTELVFGAQAAKGAAAAGKQAPALNSKINYKNSKNNAYDGKKLTRFLSDEVFKSQEYDPEKRWNVVSKQFRQGLTIIAKTLHTSTIEEEGDDDAIRARRMWKAADQNNPLETGETESGLWRLFLPAYRGDVLDSYGRSDEAASKRKHDAKRKRLLENNDVDGYIAYCRANPYTIEEALTTAAKGSFLNAQNINAALAALADLNAPVTGLYDLAWTDETQTRVKAVSNEVNGRFRLVHKFVREDAYFNQVEDRGTVVTTRGVMTKWKPLNDVRHAIGCDPIDRFAPKDIQKSSRFAAHAYRKRDLIYEANERYEADGVTERRDYWPTDGFIGEYHCRLADPRIHYEDMVKWCHWLGCQMLAENNKDKICDYFRERGYGLFLAIPPETTAVTEGKKKSRKKRNQVEAGITAGVETKRDYYEYKIDFCNDQLQDWRRCPFKSTLEQDLEFDILDTKKYDLSVSKGWTLTLARRYIRERPKSTLSRAVFDPRTYFK